MLERRDDVLALGAEDHLGRGVAGQERVFALGLGLAARQRRAGDVHRRAEPLVEPLAARLGPHHLPVGERQRAVERRRQRLAGRHRRGARVAQPVRAVVGVQRGTPKLASAAKLPRASWIFWSVLSAASSSLARVSGGWLGCATADRGTRSHVARRQARRARRATWPTRPRSPRAGRARRRRAPARQRGVEGAQTSFSSYVVAAADVASAVSGRAVVSPPLNRVKQVVIRTSTGRKRDQFRWLRQGPRSGGAAAHAQVVSPATTAGSDVITSG